MFVTDALTPLEMMAELLRIDGCLTEDTAAFRTLRHNADLCPAFRDRVDTMLRTYMAYRADVRDTQGPRDEGVDVDIRFLDQEDGTVHAALQIKSFDDIENWRTKKDKEFLTRLKAQIAAATQKLRLDAYWILLCTDAVAHAEQIRLISSELLQYDDVRIVEPVHALALFEARNEWLSAFVARRLCARDRILEDALGEVEDLGVDFAYVLAELLGMACDDRSHVDQETLGSLYDRGRELAAARGGGEDRADELIWALEHRGLHTAIGEVDRLDVSRFPKSWTALYFDASYRGAVDPHRRLMSLLDLTEDRRGRWMRRGG
ncbi:hypothetical protein [Qipengyuania flava]|jgi:hypothetical protein|uniref:hypothetical protein n=1 Tax=Qipengyuania flava TaxID=192812 RepID=UPI001C57D950|nr:hypothetical protein [Qipengyuania flava]MBW3169410.1 hypothetical protein [Qipengyuania flava]MBY5966648.1 hypothetical protein [Qipengyuania flava]MBY6012972.1 hypothetical protein [Qipengyuania flava]MBY6027414.1 hypothetical protein [Qipengyuania flava]